MATNNTRVAAYLPQDITDALNAFKSERGLIDADTKDEKGLRANDSQALITILAEFFGVSQEVAHPSSLDLVKRIEALETEVFKKKVKVSKSSTKSEPPQLETPSLFRDSASEPESDSSPDRADGGRWLISRDGYVRAVERGYKDDIQTFRRWSGRKQEDCLQQVGLRRLPAGSGSNVAPVFEDMEWDEHQIKPR